MRAVWLIAMVLSLALGCAGVDSGDVEAREGLARIEQARAEVERARTALAGDGPPDVALRRASFDEAHAAYQAMLADFLSKGLSERPSAAETREALELYTTEAIRHADDVRARGGDAEEAMRLLRRVESYWERTGASAPPSLESALGRGASRP